MMESPYSVFVHVCVCGHKHLPEAQCCVQVLLSERLTTGWENEPASHTVGNRRGGLGSSELFPRVLVRVYVCVVVISRTAPLSTDNSLPQANLNEQV